ncbi:MAG: AAA family ATPase [Balneola sp.]
MIQKRRTLRKYGVEDKGVYRGEIHEMHIEDIKDAVKENQACALIGEFGSGKTTISDMAIQDLTSDQKNLYNIIYVDSADLEKLSIGNILEAIVHDIGGGETPFRSNIARSRQTRRILGEKVKAGYKNVLLIDNAHRLHSNVLLALKDEHEKKYMGLSPLFSIVYVGQEKLLKKLSTYTEVFWRTLILNLQDKESKWMNYQERINYLETVYGPAITPIARDRIARKTRSPLHMEFIVNEKMEEGLAAGKSVLDEEVVQLTLRERREALGLSLQQLADKSNVGKTTIHEIETGLPSRKQGDVEAALEALEQKQFGDNSKRKTA